MEENENENGNENSHKKQLINSISMISQKSPHADPLFSSLITLYVLILLYLPRSIFLKIIFSPVLIITFTLLLALLRFGATQRNKNKENTESDNCTSEATDDDHQTKAPSSPCYSDQDQNWVVCKVSSFAPNRCFEDSFVEWNVRAPLEVIYEANEGEEKDEENVNDDQFLIEKYASLSLYYPETDDDSDASSDSGGDFGSPAESVCFRWEDEEDREEGLIEIAFDDNQNNNNNNNSEILDLENFHGEEEEENNLIEIDISSVSDELKRRLSGQ